MHNVKPCPRKRDGSLANTSGETSGGGSSVLGTPWADWLACILLRALKDHASRFSLTRMFNTFFTDNWMAIQYATNVRFHYW